MGYKRGFVYSRSITKGPLDRRRPFRIVCWRYELHVSQKQQAGARQIFSDELEPRVFTGGFLDEKRVIILGINGREKEGGFRARISAPTTSLKSELLTKNSLYLNA